MNVILANLDLVTDDLLVELGAALRRTNLHVITYNESLGNPFSFDGGSLSMNGLPLMTGSEQHKLIALAPGHVTMKYVHELLQYRKSIGTPYMQIGVILPEYWIMKKRETLSCFEFDTFRTFASRCIGAAYPGMFMAASTAACATYYANRMFGGFAPKIASISALCGHFNLVRHTPVGLG